MLLLFHLFHNSRFWKPERIFLAAAATAGLLMILTLPPHKVGMDEEIHFGRAWYLFDTLAGKETVTVHPVMNDLITASMNNWRRVFPSRRRRERRRNSSGMIIFPGIFQHLPMRISRRIIR